MSLEQSKGRVAGPDKTDERVPPLLQALLKRFPILRREPHLVTVHFPLVFAIVVPFFNLIYLLRPRRPTLEKTAFYLLVLGAATTPVAILTGFYTWWLNFKAGRTSRIKVKISVSLVLLADMAVLLAWRIADGEIMRVSSRSRVVYLTLSLLMPALAGVLGRVGGRLSGHT